MLEGRWRLRALFAPRRSGGAKLSLETVGDRLAWKVMLYITLYHVSHLWDSLKWLTLHESHQTVSKMSTFVEFCENWVYFHRIQRISSTFLVPWTNDTQSCIYACMSSYLLISKAHTHDNHFFHVRWKSGYNSHYNVSCGMKQWL